MALLTHIEENTCVPQKPIAKYVNTIIIHRDIYIVMHTKYINAIIIQRDIHCYVYYNDCCKNT